MNYTLQVLKGRSDVAALRLIDGVNSVGRHDDCVIRIRSAQVSRRHCEIFEADGRLMVRDLGSSNGTYVNGLRVLGQQPLNAGDVVGIGGVALRVDSACGAAVPASAPAGGSAEVDQVPEVLDAGEVDEADDFEVSADVAVADADDLGFDISEFTDSIPLDEPEPEPVPEPAKPAKKSKKKAKAAKAEEPSDDAPTLAGGGEDDAVAQFLSDLKLDEND